MIYVADTHALVWFLERNPRLPEQIRSVLRSAEAAIVIPTICLAELVHLSRRGRIRANLPRLREELLTVGNCRIYPLDDAVVELLPEGLDIHDAIVVATAILCGRMMGQPVRLLTCDKVIAESGLVQTLW